MLIYPVIFIKNVNSVDEDNPHNILSLDSAPAMVFKEITSNDQKIKILNLPPEFYDELDVIRNSNKMPNAHTTPRTPREMVSGERLAWNGFY